MGTSRKASARGKRSEPPRRGSARNRRGPGFRRSNTTSLMSFETFVALRYLVASRRRAHVALISTISVLGLAVGVAALVISLSLLSGFQDRIRAQMAD